MIDNTQFWFDITRQVDEWRMSGAKTKLYTGYGGPYMVNETITAMDYATLKHQWKEYGKTINMETRIAKSGSGLQEGIFDFICHPFNNAQRGFVYHIKVEGARIDDDASPWVTI